MLNKPKKHNRRSIRLKGYDYSQAGFYFITICTKDRKCLFGEIVNNEMVLNEFGIIVYEQWLKLPVRFTNAELNVFQIMPNHMHGIIMLKHMVGAALAVAPSNNNPNENAIVNQTGAGASPAPTHTKHVGEIVGAYKSLTTIGCLELYKQKNCGKMMGKLWQRNYYEHIVRDDQSYQRISNYIKDNPKNWTGKIF